jgi:hypothetical protein
MSCASGRVSVTLIRGCGLSIAKASVSDLEANFLPITSNGGALDTSLRWSADTVWHRKASCRHTMTHGAKGVCNLSVLACNVSDPRVTLRRI